MHLLPSRGRPALLQRFFDEGKPEQPGVVIIEEDQREAYRAVRLPENWRLLVGGNGLKLGYVAAANLGFNAAPNEPWYSLCGDDSVGRTPHWDTLMAAEVRTGIVWPRDGVLDHCTQPFVRGDICRALGWFAHPKLKHLWCDTVWHDIQHALGIGRLISSVMLEHMHFSVHKAHKDQTYLDRQIFGQRAIYEQIRRELPVLLEKVKPCIQSEAPAASVGSH